MLVSTNSLRGAAMPAIVAKSLLSIEKGHVYNFLAVTLFGRKLALGRGGTHIGGTSGARFALVRAFVTVHTFGNEQPRAADRRVNVSEAHS